MRRGPLLVGVLEAYWSVLFFTFDGAVLWTWTHLVGAGLLVLGLLVLAGLAGWLIGRRRALA